MRRRCWGGDGRFRPAIALWSLLAAGPAFAACALPRISQGMPYAQAREVILKAGFEAPAPPEDGYKSNDTKVIAVCGGSVKICDRYPELLSCKGADLCTMRFYDHRNHLDVFVYGEIADGITVEDYRIVCD